MDVLFYSALTAVVLASLLGLRLQRASFTVIACMIAAWAAACWSHFHHRDGASCGFCFLYFTIYWFWRIFLGPGGKRRRKKLIASMGLTDVSLASLKQQTTRAFSCSST